MITDISIWYQYCLWSYFKFIMYNRIFWSVKFLSLIRGSSFMAGFIFTPLSARKCNVLIQFVIASTVSWLGFLYKDDAFVYQLLFMLNWAWKVISYLWFATSRIMLIFIFLHVTVILLVNFIDVWKAPYNM